MKNFILNICLILVFIACTKNNTNNNTLNVALTADISTVDPALSYDTVSAQVVYQIFESLYEYEYLVRPFVIKPLLASEMPTISADGKTYIIKIKPNINFHPHPDLPKNRTLKAQDFIMSIKRIAFIKTMSPGWWLFTNKIIGLDEFRSNANTVDDLLNSKIEGLNAIDDLTLEIKLKRRYPQLIYALTMALTAPMPSELVAKFKNEFNGFAVGTGPFKLDSVNLTHHAKLSKFTNYRESYYPNQGDEFAMQNNLLKDQGKKIPFLDGIHFHVVKEAQTQWLNFVKQKIDYLVLTKDHFSLAITNDGALKPELKENGVKMQITPTLTYWWLAFNMNDPIVGKNQKLRAAIAHSIDIDNYIKIFTNNLALKANSIIPPGVPGHNPSHLSHFQYNPQKAKDLLREAGYPEGKGLPALNYDVRGSNTLARQMGEYIQDALGKIGIKVNIIINTFPAFLSKARSGQLQMWQGGWSMDFPDPENAIQLLTTHNHPPGPNTTYYSNPEVDAIYKQMAEGEIQYNSAEHVNRVQSFVDKDLPWVLLYYSRNYVLTKKDLHNFRDADIMYNCLKYLRLN